MDTLYERLRLDGFLKTGGLGRNPFWLKALIKVGTQEQSRSGILSAVCRQALSQELDKPLSAQRAWRTADLPSIPKDHYIEETRHGLGALALKMELGRSLPKDTARALLVPWLEKRSKELGVPPLTPDQILELARDAGLLNRVSAPVEFSHRIIQEFFLAQGLCNNRPLGENQLKAYIDDSGYWQTLSIYAGSLSSEERDAFIREILAVDTSPRGLACALAAYVGDNQLKTSAVERDLYAALRTNLAHGAGLNPQLRESLREFLSKGHDLAAEFLGILLADADPVVRTHVCQLLSLSDAPEALRILAFIGLDDREDVVGEAAVAACLRCCR